jgi:hypothetical protein
LLTTVYCPRPPSSTSFGRHLFRGTASAAGMDRYIESRVVSMESRRAHKPKNDCVGTPQTRISRVTDRPLAKEPWNMRGIGCFRSD